jgi:hypothetical protein
VRTLTNWRLWVLGLLFLAPPAVLVGLGFAWLGERGWALWGSLAWVTSAVVFSVLSVRWTRTRRTVLPPLDWSAPRTFAPIDREAWSIVLAEAEQADRLKPGELGSIDLYIKTGQRLAERLARHYHPNAADPIERVPVAELLTALELASEDLGRLLREVPGGDIVTLAHWKTGQQVASFMSKAGEYYNYLLPLFQPVQGLVRLGAQKLMAEPAWRGMQLNILRWFYRAFVQRLGTHLIEMYSGRLGIGADLYRKLTRRRPLAGLDPKAEAQLQQPLRIVVAGARDAGKTTLIDTLEKARAESLDAVRARLERDGLDPTLAELLAKAELDEAPSYTVHDEETARDRLTRRAAVADAVRTDLLLLVIDGTRDDFTADARLLQEWHDWYATRPGLDEPPVLVVLTGIDRDALLGDAEPGAPRAVVTKAARDAAVRARVEAARQALPSGVLVDIVPVGLGTPTVGIAERLMPELAGLLHRAERAALIRNLHRHATRSKAGRVIGQVGRHGRRLWEGLADNVRGRFRRRTGGGP